MHLMEKVNSNLNSGLVAPSLPSWWPSLASIPSTIMVCFDILRPDYRVQCFTSPLKKHSSAFLLVRSKWTQFFFFHSNCFSFASNVKMDMTVTICAKRWSNEQWLPIFSSYMLKTRWKRNIASIRQIVQVYMDVKLMVQDSRWLPSVWKA